MNYKRYDTLTQIIYKISYICNVCKKNIIKKIYNEIFLNMYSDKIG
jgi:hypothetical protein